MFNPFCGAAPQPAAADGKSLMREGSNSISMASGFGLSGLTKAYWLAFTPQTIESMRFAGKFLKFA
jgi:hypothetical protein